MGRKKIGRCGRAIMNFQNDANAKYRIEDKSHLKQSQSHKRHFHKVTSMLPKTPLRDNS